MGSYASYSRYGPRSPRGKVADLVVASDLDGPDVPGHVRIVRVTDGEQRGRAALDDPQRSDADVSRSGIARPVRDRGHHLAHVLAVDLWTAGHPPARRAGLVPLPTRRRVRRRRPSRARAWAREHWAGLALVAMVLVAAVVRIVQRADWPHRSSSATSSSTRTWRRTSPTTATTCSATPRSIRACSTRCCSRLRGSRTRWVRPMRWQRGSPQPRWRSPPCRSISGDAGSSHLLLALLAAALTLLLPAFFYSEILMTEGAFLPAFRPSDVRDRYTLERPTLLAQLAAFAAIALAVSIRVQGIVLLLVVPTAVLLKVVFDARAGVTRAELVAWLRRLWPTGALLAGRRRGLRLLQARRQRRAALRAGSARTARSPRLTTRSGRPPAGPSSTWRSSGLWSGSCR